MNGNVDSENEENRSSGFVSENFPVKNKVDKNEVDENEVDKNEVDKNKVVNRQQKVVRRRGKKRQNLIREPLAKPDQVSKDGPTLTRDPILTKTLLEIDDPLSAKDPFLSEDPNLDEILKKDQNKEQEKISTNRPTTKLFEDEQHQQRQQQQRQQQQRQQQQHRQQRKVLNACLQGFPRQCSRPVGTFE